MTNTKKSAVKETAKTATSKTVASKTAKATETVKTVKPIKSKRTEAMKAEAAKTKTKAPASSKTPAKKKTVEVEEAIKEVALKINKEYSGINLFFVDRKYYTHDDKEFFSETHMKWHSSEKYWFTKLRDKDQVVRIVNHFKDRIDVPSDIKNQIDDVLGTTKSTNSKSKASKGNLQYCPF